MSEVVAAGTMKNKKDQLIYSYTMRVLNTQHLNEVLDLQQYILDRLENPELCVYLSESEVYDMLADFGEMVGVYVDNTIIAFASILFPGKREENLGRDIGLADEKLTQVAHLEFAAVHPIYRGNSLQKKMAAFLVERLINDGHRYYLFNTISPYNPVSLDTGFYLRFAICRLSLKYGGILRYTLQRNLENSLKVNKDTIITISTLDLDNQQELLKKGYYGFGFADDTKSGIIFGKVISE